MKRRWFGMIAVLGLCLSNFWGCGFVDQAREAVNEKVGNAIVGEPQVVDSISQDCYGYQQLNEQEQVVYDQILQCMLSYEEKVPISTKDEALLQKVYDCVTADYGNIFWVSGYQYNTYSSMDQIIGMDFAPKYVFTKEEKEAYQVQVDEVAAQWLAGIDQNASDFEKTKYVYETLIEQIEYVKDSENNQNILSAFLGKQTVCQGYAGATQYLLKQLGIPCTIVRGYANGELHAWNLVLLDGAYYFTDTTWGNSRYLMPDSSIQKRIDYQYLNTTSAFLSETHVVEMPIPIPECTATENSYY